MVIPVWALRGGAMGSFTPVVYRSILRDLKPDFVADNINGAIEVNERSGTRLGS